jgi:cysteine-rich repeat protein
MINLGRARKTVAILANLSLFLNSFLPFVLAIQPVYAQSSEEAAPTEVVQDSPTPEATPTIVETTPTPETTVTPEATSTPEITITPEPTPTPEKPMITNPINSEVGTLTPPLDVTSTSSAEITPTQFSSPSWTFEKVELNKEYIDPQNSEVKLTFTKLPENSGNIKIEEITLTPEQIQQTGSLSNKAYDITSDMADGTFAYNLSLPIPESSKGKDVDIKFTEDISQIDSVKTAYNTTETNSAVSAANLDHFTLFIVTYSDSSLTVQKNSYTQGETVYAKGLNLTYIIPLKIVFRDNKGNEITNANCPTETGWSTSCSYKLPADAPVGIWTAELFSNYSKIDSTTFEVLSQNCNYSCPTTNFSASRTLIDVLEHYADCNSGTPNIDGKTCTVISTVYETKYADKILGSCPSFDVFYSSDKNTKPCSRIIGKTIISITNRTYIPTTYKTETFNKTVAYEKSATSNNCVKPSSSSLGIPLWALNDFDKLSVNENYVITPVDGYYLENNVCHQKNKVCTNSNALNYDSNVNINTEIIDNTVCTYTPAGVCPTTCGYSGSNNSIPDGFGGYQTCTATAACYVPVCGNDILDPNETCDDGNIANGDGCSNSCTIENNWKCFGNPSSCLNTPILNLPLNNALFKGNPTQSWNSVIGVDHYIYESYKDTYITNPANLIYTENTGKNNYRTVGGNQTISFYWRVKAVDSIGNESNWSELRKLNIDNTFPIITIGTYTTAPTNQNITVTATSDGNLNVGSTTFTSNGSFDFIATDEVGNIITKTVTITNIDKVAPIFPNVIFTANGVAIPTNGYTNSQKFTFNLSSVDTVRYQLKYWNNISNSTFKINSPWNPSNLSGYSSSLGVYNDKFTQGEGAHYFAFSACDVAGNCSKYSEPFIITYDKTTPIVTFTGTNPSGLTKQNNQTFTVSTNEPVKSCTLIGLPVDHSMVKNEDGTYSVSVENIADGIINYSATCTDLAGNPGNSEVKSFTVDTQKPQLSNKTEFGNTWYKTDQISTFTFIDENGIASGNNPTCVISTEGSLQTCSTDLNVCDKAGNCNTETIVSNSANIDKTNPIIGLSVNPTNPDASNGWYKTQPEISATATDTNLSTFQYQWDSKAGAWINYTGALKPLSEGTHTLYLQAKDLAGNIIETSKEVKWDQTEPTGPQNITADPNPTSGSTSKIRWDFAKDNIGIDRYEIQWNLNDTNNPLSYSKTVGAGDSSVDIDQLIEGRWTVKVIAFDQSGQSKDNSIDLNVDRSGPVAPTLKITGTGTGTVTLSWNAVSDAQDYIIWYGDTAGKYLYGARVGNVTSYTVQGLGAGNYYFTIKSVDAAQNQSGYSNEVNTGTIAGTPGVAPGQPAAGFTGEVKGVSTGVTPTVTEASKVLGASTEKGFNWWWLLLILFIIPLYAGSKKVFKKKRK